MIYDELGVKSYINALDPVAAYGGNLLSPTVLDAMEEATRSFVRMDELHRAVGECIAEMTHNEGAAVVSGASAGMMMCAAALVVNADAQLPPRESLWKYTQAGAAAAIFAGGRALCGPSGSAIVVGQKWLTDAILSIAPPKHSIASVANIGREEIVGLYAALEEYMAGDDYAAKIERVERIIREERHRIEGEGYFLCRRSYPGPSGQNYPRMMLEILGSYSAEALVEMLQEGDPAILVTRTDNSESENGIYINLMTLTDEEVEIVLRRVDECAESLTRLS